MAARFPTFAALVLWSLASAAAPIEWPAYKLTATIDPPTHRLTTVAEVTLPAAMAGKMVEFVLGANFQITASRPTAEKLPVEASASAFAGRTGSW